MLLILKRRIISCLCSTVEEVRLKRCLVYVVVILAVMGVISANEVINPKDLTRVKFEIQNDSQKLVLVKDGLPQFKLLMPQKVHKKVKEAISAFQQVMKLSYGAEVPTLKNAADAKDQTLIVIGQDPKEQRFQISEMANEAFKVVTEKQALHILAKDLDGLAWGVYDVLERFFGVRFYWPGDDGMSLPKSSEVMLPLLTYEDKPVFAKRDIWPSKGGRVNKAVYPHHQRMRANNRWPVRLLVHAPKDWKKKYGQERPQIFQKQGDGSRNQKMLCYGHPETLKTYLEEIELQRNSKKKLYRKSLIVSGDSITVSPADYSLTCKCEYCQALWDDQGGAYGSASVIMGKFVEKLAHEVKDKWPEMTIAYLPYKNYTYAPKGIKFPGNVEVQICGMPGLAQHADEVIKKTEQDNIDAWIELSGKKVQNWHYNCWPADRTQAAYHYFNTIQEHYQDNLNKTVGTFVNGVKDHWPRQNISLYVWMRILWNPELDLKAVLSEYIHRMFGPAAKEMGALVEMQRAGWEDHTWSTHKFSPKSVYEESYPFDDVLKMEKLLQAAIDKASADELVSRRLEYLKPSLENFFKESRLIVKGEGVKVISSQQTPENPQIDGKLDDACWTGVESVSMDVANPKKQKVLKFPTEIKSVWSREGITFGFICQEPETEKLAIQYKRPSWDGSNIWWDDNVEIFLDITGERSDYHQFIINADGAVYDSHGKDFSWNAKGMLAAAHHDKGWWSLEVYIPYAAFEKEMIPGTALQWLGNFTRHRVTDRKNRELQRLNSNQSASSSDQNAFGPIKFIER